MNQKLVLTQIENMIYLIRGQKVMLDSDLATLYDTEIKRLNEQVKRNEERFPLDFMFQLTSDETEVLKNQSIHFKEAIGSRKYPPYVFTENGVAMLSSVLNSPKAIQVNISIMRIFTKLRSFLLLENQMNDRMGKLEENTHKLFKIVFERLDSIDEDITPHLPNNRPKIGLKDEK
jgi:transcription termination factor NusB